MKQTNLFLLALVSSLFSLSSHAQSIPSWAVSGQTQVYIFGPRGNQIYRSVFTNKTDGLTQDSLTFKVYPNPASSVLNIELEDDMEFDFQVYTADGRFVQEFSVSGMKSLNVSNYSNGKYFLIPIKEENVGQFISFIVLK